MSIRYCWICPIAGPPTSNTEALKSTNRLTPFVLAKSMKAFIGGKMSITAGAVRKAEVMFWALSNGALNVLLSSQSNRQPAKPACAVPLRDARIVGCPYSFSICAIELATLPVPPSRRIVGLEDIPLRDIGNWYCDASCNKRGHVKGQSCFRAI